MIPSSPHMGSFLGSFRLASNGQHQLAGLRIGLRYVSTMPSKIKIASSQNGGVENHCADPFGKIEPVMLPVSNTPASCCVPSMGLTHVARTCLVLISERLIKT